MPWILTTGEYDDYKVIGVFDSEDDADAAVSRIASDPNLSHLMVEEVPRALPTFMHVHVCDVLHLTSEIAWDGRVINRRDESSVDVVNGLADDDAVAVTSDAYAEFESSKRATSMFIGGKAVMGVRVSAFGRDTARVDAEHASMLAAVVADPAGECIRLWRDGAGKRSPIWDYPENAGLLAMLAASGVQRHPKMGDTREVPK